MAAVVQATALAGLPEIGPGTDLAALIAAAAGPALTAGTVVCIAQKLVSKAEGRIVALDEIEPTPAVAMLAEASGRDPRLTQVVLDESTEVIRAERGVLICRTRHGFVCANAGVDRSNAGPGGGDHAILLPLDPDASARRLKASLEAASGVAPLAVLVSDSFGRAWRIGQVDVAIGVAGLLPAPLPKAGDVDRDGRALVATQPAVADEAAAAAGLARTKAGGEGVVLVRGLDEQVTAADGPGAAALVRARHEDLFGARNADAPVESGTPLD